jgi:hypothetical protein
VTLLLLAMVYSLQPIAYSQVRVQPRPTGFTVSSETVAVLAATIDSAAVPTTSTHEAMIQWKFGTVVGVYTTCTVQMYTTYDGTNYLSLGSAASVTVTTGTINAWSVINRLGIGTGVYTSAVSATDALGFGQLTKFTFACSGGYGTSAPATVTVIYR